MEALYLLEIKGMKFPLDRKYYTKDGAHIWLKSEGDVVKVGMDAFAVEMAGLLTFLTVAKKEAKSGEAVGSFESAKFVSRFYSPINGEIVEVNEEVLKNPRKINEDPYNSWIMTIKPEADEDSKKYILEDEDDIKKWISEELKRVEEDE